MRSRKTIELTIEEAAAEFGIDRRTLQTRLTQAGCKPNENNKHTIIQCHRAIFGDIDGEKLRETRHRANLLELQEATLRRESIPAENVQREWSAVIIAIRQALWNFDAPEAVRRRWLGELRDLKVEDYFTTAKPVEQDE